MDESSGDGSRGSSGTPPAAVEIATRSSLRARFFALFVVLGLLALFPYFVAERNHQKLDGFAIAIEETGSLRYRLLQIQLELPKAAKDPESREHVESLLRDQRELLAASASGQRTKHLATCPTADVCERFRAHLKRWDEQLEPRLREALTDASKARLIEPATYLEVSELDLTVRAFARVIQERTERNIRIGLLASIGSMAFVVLAVFGVWSVFRRVEHLRRAAENADEGTLRQESQPRDELGSLAASLALGISSERARRQAEQRRTKELRQQQLATRQCAESLSAWIAGERTLADALSALAAATGHARAELERASNGSSEGAKVAAPAQHALELSWGEKRLGTLVLSGHTAPHEASDAVLLDTLSQIVAIACLAEQLLTEKSEQGRLAVALGSVAGRPTSSDFGASLHRLVAHDAALVELYDDQGHVEDVWAVHSDRLERVASMCDSHQPTQTVRSLAPGAEGGCAVLRRRCDGAQLEIPLRTGSQLIGSLNLARAASGFSSQDVLAAEALAPIVSAALARIQLESRLRSAEQWSTLGAFGRLLAHEIKNPLNSLGLELQLLERRLGKLELEPERREKLVSSISVVKNELARLTTLTADYLSLSPKSGDMTMSPIELRDIAREVVRAHEAELAERAVRLHVELGSEPLLVNGNAGRLKQLLHNLLGNAIDAVSGRQVREIAVVTRQRDGTVDLVVSDTGSGITDPIAIFAPGYSTKPSGTGMGLAISQQVARQHHGRLIARERSGGGAEFMLTLPVLTTADAQAS